MSAAGDVLSLPLAAELTGLRPLSLSGLLTDGGVCCGLSGSASELLTLTLARFLAALFLRERREFSISSRSSISSCMSLLWRTEDTRGAPGGRGERLLELSSPVGSPLLGQVCVLVSVCVASAGFLRGTAGVRGKEGSRKEPGGVLLVGREKVRSTLPDGKRLLLGKPLSGSEVLFILKISGSESRLPLRRCRPTDLCVRPGD